MCKKFILILMVGYSASFFAADGSTSDETLHLLARHEKEKDRATRKRLSSSGILALSERINTDTFFDYGTAEGRTVNAELLGSVEFSSQPY